jgi:hypothetical protein
VTTDFERFGLSKGPVAAPGRLSLPTVDFEAFTSRDIPDWVSAMSAWSNAAEGHHQRFSFFVAVEDVTALRSADSHGYRAFCQGIRMLARCGADFQPHNHCVFDPATGRKLSEWTGWPQQAPGYTRRTSMYYDVVHRHGLSWADWLGVVIDEFRRFLEDADVPQPTRLAFRAGGWDCGSSPDEVRDYVGGLEERGVQFDSSASTGVFGSRSWKVGAPFGRNVFKLGPDLTEIAPCWSVNVGGTSRGRSITAAAARLIRQPRVWLHRGDPGIFVSVLHFDHLVRHGDRGSLVNLVRVVRSLEQGLRLENVTFASPTLPDMPHSK